MRHSASDRLGGWRAARWLACVALLLSARAALAACGDGILDVGESCDDRNQSAGDCCSPSCLFDPAGSPCADDANLCTDDVCDGNGLCTYVPNTTPCDDGDPCTADDACSAARCSGRPVPAQCIDGALCYRARSIGTFDAGSSLDLFDQRNQFAARPRRVRRMCLPANTTGDALRKPAVWLEGYTLSTRFRGTGSFAVSDELNSISVRLDKPDRLLLATFAHATDPPVSPPNTETHYSCRRLFGASAATNDLTVDVHHELGDPTVTLGRPVRLCSPTIINEPEAAGDSPSALLLCYDLRARGPQTQTFLVHTANELGVGDVAGYRAEELCLPASGEDPPRPCLTTGDECGLPCCKRYPGQHPDCDYDPVVSNPRYFGCTGPLILVDRTHANFHQITPESTRNPGRFWGFAKLLARDGYVVRDSTIPFAQLLATTTAEILVLANPRTLVDDPTLDAVSPADAALLATWVANGGSLLLSIDHHPFERVGALLAAFGLDRLFDGDVSKFTFTRASGDLNGTAAIANGSQPGEEIGEVTTFRGTAFSIASTTPPSATYEPVLILPPGEVGGPSDDGSITYLQGVAIQFGAGRVYVSGESGGLTVQGFGMHETPDNEQFLLNLIHWLDQ
jgi:cysteine-rich repeat protein